MERHYSLLQVKPAHSRHTPPAQASPCQGPASSNVGKKELPPSPLRDFHPSLLLCIPALLPRWVFLHEKAYQVRDTAIESSVVTKVKGFGRYANRVMDVSDYVTPPQVWSLDPTWLCR